MRAAALLSLALLASGCSVSGSVSGRTIGAPIVSGDEVEIARLAAQAAPQPAAGVVLDSATVNALLAALVGVRQPSVPVSWQPEPVRYAAREAVTVAPAPAAVTIEAAETSDRVWINPGGTKYHTHRNCGQVGGDALRLAREDVAAGRPKCITCQRMDGER